MGFIDKNITNKINNQYYIECTFFGNHYISQERKVGKSQKRQTQEWKINSLHHIKSI